MSHYLFMMIAGYRYLALYSTSKTPHSTSRVKNKQKKQLVQSQQKHQSANQIIMIVS